MLLDLRLPDGSGLDFLRAQADAPPTIVVSALGDEPTVVEALNLGAEDFVTKPFRMKELLARVSGTLRRHTVVQPSASVSPSETIRSGAIVMNFATFEVECDGDLAGLTRSEFQILEHFMKNPDRVLTRKQLCDEALDAGGSVQERTIDAHIRTIRRKMGEQGKRIATVWGVGYRLLDPEAGK
jgi:DNA-binding response OmpR family regulator